MKAEYLQISASAIQRAGIFGTADPGFPSMPENVAQRNEGHVIQFSPSINEPNKLIASSRMTNSASLTQEQLSAQSVEYFAGGKSKQSATTKQPVRKQPSSSKMTGAHHPN